MTSSFIDSIGVVELGELVGRDYTTVSRQAAKVDSLGLLTGGPQKPISECAKQ
jgi:predicted transcriptional regulator